MHDVDAKAFLMAAVVGVVCLVACSPAPPPPAAETPAAATPAAPAPISKDSFGTTSEGVASGHLHVAQRERLRSQNHQSTAALWSR